MDPAGASVQHARQARAKHAPDLRRVVDAMLYVSHTGCQWRFLPESFRPWTRVWSQFRRWSRSGTWARALTVLHAAAGRADRPTETTPSMMVRDTHLARGASNGGLTFHDLGGPSGRAKGAKRIVAVDVTGLPVGADTLGRRHALEVRRAGWDEKQSAFRPIRHARRVEVAHGRLGLSRRLATWFENTATSATGWLQVACIATTLRHLSRAQVPRRALPAAA